MILIKLLNWNILKKIILSRIMKIKLTEAIDWVRKYFKEASDVNKLLDWEMMGINLNKLISKPIQHPIHEFDEMEIKVLITRI